MKTVTDKNVSILSGERVPAFGMGTWKMGEDPAEHTEELATLQLGIDLGATLIDTAEMYGNGSSENLVGEAIQGRRDDIFLVTKVLPQNASIHHMPKSCDASLRRLGTDRIDLYLLHWRGDVPISETLEAFIALQAKGKIRHYGFSNFDLDDMREVWTTHGGEDAQTNQVLYNLSRRGIEWDLQPSLRDHGLPIMAYSPIEEARLLQNANLTHFARRHDMTPAQVALAWLLAKDDVVVIPKTSHRERLRENLGSLEVQFTPEQLAELDRLFPPPNGPRPLEMI